MGKVSVSVVKPKTSPFFAVTLEYPNLSFTGHTLIGYQVKTYMIGSFEILVGEREILPVHYNINPTIGEEDRKSGMYSILTKTLDTLASNPEALIGKWTMGKPPSITPKLEKDAVALDYGLGIGLYPMNPDALDLTDVIALNKDPFAYINFCEKAFPVYPRNVISITVNGEEMVVFTKNGPVPVEGLDIYKYFRQNV